MSQSNNHAKKSLLSTIAIVVVAVLLLIGQQMGILPNSSQQNSANDVADEVVSAAVEEVPAEEDNGPIIEPQAIVNYMASHGGKLPDNFITKNEAQKLGWDSASNYVSDVAPGKSIGGDNFGNYEGILPTNTKYHEADCYYTGGKRNAYRLVYSNDGHYYYTEDHYESFTELFPTE